MGDSLLDKHSRLVGSGGLSVANQIYNRFLAAGKPLGHGDIAVLDAAEFHYYQVRLHGTPSCYSRSPFRTSLTS